jgi:STE24 endopeptidase
MTTLTLFERWWWTAAAPILAMALVGALHGGPALLARLGTVRPLVRGDLAPALSELARVAGVPIAGIQEWVIGEEARTTALVTGIGPSRRVLISSQVAGSWRDDEIAVVVAHELAHHAHHDLWRALGLNAAVLCAALWASDVAVRWVGFSLRIAGPGDPAALPLMALVAGAVWLICTPLRHAQSRRQERRADVFALEATGQAEAFAAAIRRLGERQLVEDRPSRLTRWLYHRHPSVSERLALAEAYRRSSTRA